MSDEAEVIRCESCGAPAKPESEKCEYCGSYFKEHAIPFPRISIVSCVTGSSFPIWGSDRVRY